jgi:tRNA dimethylallyltransferase
VPSSENNSKPRVLVIVGPTCSGKTAVSIDLAVRLDGEIISADSRQVFKHLDIGTAKPTPNERRSIKHYFVDELSPDHGFNAGEFGERGREVIGEILRKGKLPVVVGGSGLYVQSLIDGFFEGPGADREFREALEQQARLGRIRQMLDELRRVDPDTARNIDPTKHRRIIRALEVYHLTGRPISALRRERKMRIDFQPVLFGLKWQRETLYKRIDARCERMAAEGFLAEVERIESMGYDDSLNALNTVGYTEAFAYRRGEVSFDEFMRLFKQNSRRYAKRQLTWFRADDRIMWIEMSEERSTDDVVHEIIEKFSTKTSAR